jgi:hypothetical protein
MCVERALGVLFGRKSVIIHCAARTNTESWKPQRAESSCPLTERVTLAVIAGHLDCAEHGQVVWPCPYKSKLPLFFAGLCDPFTLSLTRHPIYVLYLLSEQNASLSRFYLFLREKRYFWPHTLSHNKKKEMMRCELNAYREWKTLATFIYLRLMWFGADTIKEFSLHMLVRKF